MNQKKRETLALARLQQQAEAKAGVPARSIEDIMRQHQPAPVDFTRRQLQRRGSYGAAALLTDQAALNEKSPTKAAQARLASGMLKLLAERPQSEFDFFMGNVSRGDQYHDAIRERLLALPITPAERLAAGRVLTEIARWLGWQTHECTKTASELAALLGVHKVFMARMLKLLESVDAIRRIKRGSMKTICITPEGAYRGNMTQHAKAVEKYREVLGGMTP